jgi:hypothetical protein
LPSIVEPTGVSPKLVLRIAAALGFETAWFTPII